MVLLQEEGPLPGPETGLLSNTRKWIVRGDTCADKARDFIGKGRPGGEQQGKGTQENCSPQPPYKAGIIISILEAGNRGNNLFKATQVINSRSERLDPETRVLLCSTFGSKTQLDIETPI